MRFYYRPKSPHADQHGFVTEEHANDGPQEIARNAPIMMDRFYENTQAPDGADIGSRRKHRDYMKANGLTTMDDYKSEWDTAGRSREALRRGEHDKKERREQVERAIYKLFKY